MAGRILVFVVAGLAACTSKEELCFAEATQEYIATQSLIKQAEDAAEKGYSETADWLQFTDVSECGPTLEDRALCTTQYSKVFEGYTATDPAADRARAKSLSEKLPRLRSDAEKAHRACISNGPAGSPDPAESDPRRL